MMRRRMVLVMLGLVMLAGCATWTPEQRAAWDDLGRALQKVQVDLDAIRHDDEHRRMQGELAVMRLHQATMEAPGFRR